MSKLEISKKELERIKSLCMNVSFSGKGNIANWFCDIIPRLITAYEHKKAELDAANKIIELAKDLPKSVLRRYLKLQQALRELDNESKPS